MAKSRQSIARILTPTVVLAAVVLVASTAASTVAVVKITGFDVANGTLTGRDIKQDSVRGGDLTDGTVRRRDLAPGALVPGPAGPTGPQGPAGASGVPDAWVEVGSDRVLSPENDRVVAATIDLPAGSYVVTATAGVVDPFANAPMGGKVTCSVRTVGGQVLAESVLTPATSGNTTTGLIHLQVAHATASATTLQLYCLQGIGNVGVIRPTLTALAVGVLHT
jgi:hypothetical protein